MSRVHAAGGLVGWLLVAFAAAAVGALASADAAAFYASLAKPSWAPPAALFGPVWTVLYASMGVAAWLVWQRGGFAANRRPLALFAAQLLLNALWSWLFFEWHRGAASFTDIVVLWLTLVATLVAFARVHTIAALLLAPYLAWVSFAAVLNYVVWQRNPLTLG